MGRTATVAPKVAALADGTMTAQEIADALGKGRPYVSATLKRLGILDQVKRRDRVSIKVLAHRRLALIRRAHDAMSRRDPDGITTADWDLLLADIGKELGVGNG